MIITYQQTKATQFIELMEGMFGDVNGADVNGGDGYAAVPLPVRKASGFPSSQQLIWRLGRPRQSLS